ncbi:hypothetical protein, conserved [Babesia ovata]|uniref:Uncharacterized protein n=1 Tax=Babesia ovata TaxID=189622 RepID=A0A2H6KFE1_9APIC|nr:uncharacterized protein BOVATA_031720 [Babesia ovata]GBE61679.1 hypothetical protein, conserved [Babesia ovata]
MKAPAGGDKKRDLSKCVSTCPDKDGADDRRTDKLEQMKEWKSRFDEFVSYTHTVLNDVLGDTRSDATSELNSRPVNSPSGNGGSRCSPQQRTLGADPPSIQSSSQTAQKIDGGPKCACKSPNITNVDKVAYHALTEPPRNVKECMDWLIALKGKDGEKNMAALGAAVHKFLADKPVGYTKVPALEKVKHITKQFLYKSGIWNIWPAKRIMSRFNIRMFKEFCWFTKFFTFYKSDYENIIQTKGLTAKDIADKLGDVVSGCERFLKHIKNPGQYKSAYCPEATWDASFAKNPEACAVILVGIGPMFYAGLESLLLEFEVLYITGLSHYCFDNIHMMVKALGFKEPECRSSPSIVDVNRALSRLDDHELYTIYDLSGFWAFY